MSSNKMYLNDYLLFFYFNDMAVSYVCTKSLFSALQISLSSLLSADRTDSEPAPIQKQVSKVTKTLMSGTKWHSVILKHIEF